MKKYKKAIKLLIIFFLSLNLAACHVPILDKEITIPFFEKKGDEAFRLSLLAMEKMDKFNFNGDFNITIETDKELGFLDEKTKDNILAMINDGSPKVLGIDNVSESNNANPVPMLGSFPEKISISYKAKGQVDKSDKSNIKNSNNFQIKFDLGTVSFELELETIAIDNKLYLKIVKMPAFVENMLSGMNIDVASKWWKFDIESAEKLIKQAEIDTKDGLAEKMTNEEKAKEVEKKLTDLLKKNPFVKIGERKRDEKIDAEKHYHYLAGVDAEALKVFFKEAISISYSETPLNNLVNEEKKKEIEKIIDSLQTLLTKSDFEFWINKKSFNMRKMVFDLMLVLPKIESIGDKAGTGKDLLEMKGAIEYFNIDKPFEIKAPEQFEDFGELMNARIEEARLKARNAKRVADIKQIQTALELYFYDKSAYPENLNSLVQKEESAAETDPWLANAYLFDLPKDPKPNKECGEEFEYEYSTKNEGQDFELIFCLEGDMANFLKGKNIVSSMVASSSKTEMFESGIEIQGAMLDSDKDGLNDFEEEMVYFTDPNKTDTDGDGYSDGEEVLNGYNPLGGGKLNDFCRDSSDCEKYISYDSCEVLCINRSIDKNTLANKPACDNAEWEPSEELNCECLNNKCDFR